jgi:hypothetical protein
VLFSSGAQAGVEAQVMVSNANSVSQLGGVGVGGGGSAEIGAVDYYYGNNGISTFSVGPAIKPAISLPFFDDKSDLR